MSSSGPNIWENLPNYLKSSSLKEFKLDIENWTPQT